jgi:hypothetical protein
MEAYSTWTEFFEFDALSDSGLLLSLVVMLVLYALYDLYRPTTPIDFSSTYRRKRTLNWILIGVCLNVETMNNYNIIILSTKSKEALYKTGLSYSILITMIGVAYFVKPLFMIINGVIIDRLESLSRNGKFILIGGMFVHAILNFVMGCVVASTSTNNTANFSPVSQMMDPFHFETFAAPVQTTPIATVPPASSGDDTNVFTSRVIAPLFFVSHISATYLETIAELVLVKICSSWYHDRGERATISGILNVFESWNYFLGFVVNIYIFTKFNNAGPAGLLFANAACLCVASVCATMISKRWSPSNDYNYYMLLLRRQQREWEEEELRKIGYEERMSLKDLSEALESQQDTYDQEIQSEMRDMISEEALATRIHHDTPSITDDHDYDQSQKRGNDGDAHFPFEDPMILDRLTFKQVFLKPEIYIFSLAFLFLNLSSEGWLQYFVTILMLKFDIVFGSLNGVVALLSIIAAPALSCMLCVMLLNFFTRDQRFLSISLQVTISLFSYGVCSLITYLAVHPTVMIIFGFISVMFKMISLSALRYQCQTLGGNSKAATASALLWTGAHLGSGIATFMFGFFDIDLEILITFKTVIATIAPIIGSAILLVWHIRHIANDKRKNR